MIPLIDWFCASFKALINMDCFFKYFSLQKDDFKPISGRWNYQYGLWQEGITVYYSEHFNNGERTYYDMCINFSGSGCRKYETIRGASFDWIVFIDLLQRAYGKECINVSRVDLALDVKDNSVPSMLGIINLVDEHKYISQFRRVVTGRGAEEWVYFGSPSSDTRLRIYNKALERGFADKWIRFEYQFRNEAADRFLNHLVTCRDIGQVFKDFIDKSVMFTTKPNLPTSGDTYNHHTEKLRPVKWWREFVKGAGEITKLDMVGVEYNYTALQKYLDIQAGPSIAAFIKANGGDMTPLLDIVQKQDNRLNDKQKSVIRDRQFNLEAKRIVSDSELQFINGHAPDRRRLELEIELTEKKLANMRAELFGA